MCVRTGISVAFMSLILVPIAYAQDELPKKVLPKALKPLVPPDKELPPAKPKGTKEKFADFYEEYCKIMEAVGEQPTTAKKEQTHRDLIRKLGDKIDSQIWEFRCEILDVKKGDNDFVLMIGAPLEEPSFVEEWQPRTEVTNLRLSKSQGLALTPGDTVVIRGNPALTFGRVDYNSVFYSRDLQVGDSYYRHCICLKNTKFAIEKKKD